jgi:hypothetical protein
MLTRLFLFIIIFVLHSQHANSQVFQRKRKRSDEPAPKAMLVEIRTHQRKQVYYLQHRFTEKQEQLLIDIDSVRDRLAMDFNDNFSYCPVYFFVDTNRSKILAGTLEGMLLNSNLAPATEIALQPSDHYQIVYFGYPISSPEPQANTQDIFATGDVNTRSNRQQLVVLDKHGKAVRKPLPNGASSARGATLKRDVKAYRYRSPMHEVYYVPYAGNLNLKLYSFYGMYPYKRE